MVSKTLREAIIQKCGKKFATILDGHIVRIHDSVFVSYNPNEQTLKFSIDYGDGKTRGALSSQAFQIYERALKVQPDKRKWRVTNWPKF